MSIEQYKDEGCAISVYEVTHDVHPWMPKTLEELTFISQDENGRINWWDVTPANTNYWEVHCQHGRAMGKEFLGLLNNSNRKKKKQAYKMNWFARIASEIARTEIEYRRKYNTDGCGDL
jgi:hypothetical protein